MSAVPGGARAEGGNGRPNATIGVAIAVPEPYGQVLQRWRAHFGDPLGEAIPAHVTLLPPTEVPRKALPRVREHLSAVARSHRPFRVHLRGTGTFRPVSPVVFVQLAEGVSQCEQLERSVRSGVLARDVGFYYHPHVTVAHHVDAAALDRAFETLSGFEARFAVDSFSLYEHGDDGVWRPAECFLFASVGSLS